MTTLNDMIKQIAVKDGKNNQIDTAEEFATLLTALKAQDGVEVTNAGSIRVNSKFEAALKKLNATDDQITALKNVANTVSTKGRDGSQLLSLTDFANIKDNAQLSSALSFKEEKKPVEEKKPIDDKKPVEEKKPIDDKKPVEEKKPIDDKKPVEDKKPVIIKKPIIAEKQIITAAGMKAFLDKANLDDKPNLLKKILSFGSVKNDKVIAELQSDKAQVIHVVKDDGTIDDVKGFYMSDVLAALNSHIVPTAKKGTDGSIPSENNFKFGGDGDLKKLANRVTKDNSIDASDMQYVLNQIQKDLLDNSQGKDVSQKYAFKANVKTGEETVSTKKNEEKTERKNLKNPEGRTGQVIINTVKSSADANKDAKSKVVNVETKGGDEKGEF